MPYRHVINYYMWFFSQHLRTFLVCVALIMPASDDGFQKELQDFLHDIDPNIATYCEELLRAADDEASAAVPRLPAIQDLTTTLGDGRTYRLTPAGPAPFTPMAESSAPSTPRVIDDTPWTLADERAFAANRSMRMLPMTPRRTLIRRPRRKQRKPPWQAILAKTMRYESE